MTKPTALAARAIRGRLPLVAGPMWLVVVEVAGWRCECAGWCGRPHGGRRGGRCLITNAGNAPLHVLPALPGVTARQAARLAVNDLFAVCRSCHDSWASQPVTGPSRNPMQETDAEQEGGEPM